MKGVKGQATGKRDLSGEIQSLQRNSLVGALAVNHIQKAQESQADFLARSRLPYERTRERAFPHVQRALEVTERNFSQIQFFAVQRDLRPQPVRRRDHEVGMVDDPAVGFVQVFDVVDAVYIKAPQAVDRPALVEASAHAHRLVGQGEYGFTDPGIRRIEAFLDDFPGIDFEINISDLCHIAPSFNRISL